MAETRSRYPSIADYALISDCHCAALVSTTGSVDWCCMPRFDSDSCFGRLLDWDQGGYCAISPSASDVRSTRRYVPETMVLETTFETGDGTVLIYDFFLKHDDTGGGNQFELVRLIEGRTGSVSMRAHIAPRFDYGDVVPHVHCQSEGIYTAIGSNMGLVIYADMSLDVLSHHELSGAFSVQAGQRIRLAVRFDAPELIETIAAQSRASEPDGGMARTCDWWRNWARRIRFPFGPDEHSLRSALVLKSLSYERTGAIAAAPTTSLPEWIGGQRNWDYRFSWVRDSVFTVRALHELGCEEEADRFLQFVLRTSAGSAAELQIMYGVDGKRRLTEIELKHLEGYRGSKPVRIGNLASEQTQLDLYGEILDLAHEWHKKGGAIDPQSWDFLVDVVNTACEKWSQPDHGIWEVRGDVRHHVHSKAMCWGALEHGIRLAQERQMLAPMAHWNKVRAEIRDAIEREGYDARRGVFVQAFGSEYLDAALLRLPRIGFLAYDDPRMLRTTDAIRRELDRDGLLARYNSPDGLPGQEGTFLPCTFWLVHCLAYQGQHALAWQYYRRALSCANEVGLFSEEYDMKRRRMLGNFPQALTHVSQITARQALGKTEPAA